MNALELSKITQIIEKLDIPSEIRWVLLKHIDYLDEEDLFAIIRRYSEKLETIDKNNKEASLNFEKSIIQYELTSEMTESKKEANLILSQI